ncbi:hypothetical protein J6590_063872 [Homalodisca vitripennis]|nr:hypothetical protein J6590_063872 [Homalodisca vitripennis]
MTTTSSRHPTWMGYPSLLNVLYRPILYSGIPWGLRTLAPTSGTPTGVQKSDGVFGPLIVRAPMDAEIALLYDEDLLEHTFVINDPRNRYGQTLVAHSEFGQ